MDENGWDIDDTTYEINGGIELEEIKKFYYLTSRYIKFIIRLKIFTK